MRQADMILQEMHNATVNLKAHIIEANTPHQFESDYPCVGVHVEHEKHPAACYQQRTPEGCAAGTGPSC